MSRRAVVLLSGGLDSCVAACVAKAKGRDVTALRVAYGQRHFVELDHALVIASALGVAIHLVRVDLSSVCSGALLGDAAVSTGRDAATITADRAPNTFVPARNALFLTVAATFAHSIQAGEVWVGSNGDDANGYPDCRPEFFRAFESVASAGGFPVEVVHPLTALSKRQVVALGRVLRAPIDQTWSCYSPRETPDYPVPCGVCDACVLRAEALR